MQRVLSVILVSLISGACFGQTSFQGVTPGKSTKTDVQQVLGLPTNKISETLIQYKGQQGAEKIFVQYRDNSATAIVERIELTCAGLPADSRCNQFHISIQEKYKVSLDTADVTSWTSQAAILTKRLIWYFGDPQYIASTLTPSDEIRWAFYSKELFDSVAPKAVGCTYTLLGDWETNRGRMTIVRLGPPALPPGTPNDPAHSIFLQQPIKGTYSLNNGTFTGNRDISGTIQGEWKDDTGTGKLDIRKGSGYGTFVGEWTRTTGSGPAKGTWEGRCIEMKSGGNN